MDASRKKTVLIGIASSAGFLLLLALGWLLYFKLQFSVYQDELYDFSIKYPKTWKVVIHPYKNVAVVFLRPKDTALDTMQENFNVTIQPVPENLLKLDAYSATIKRQLTGTFSTIKIDEEKHLRWGWREGNMIAYQEPASHFEMVNAWVLRSDQAYILTFLGERSKYPQDALYVKEMIHSLQLH